MEKIQKSPSNVALSTSLGGGTSFITLEQSKESPYFSRTAPSTETVSSIATSYLPLVGPLMGDLSLATKRSLAIMSKRSWGIIGQAKSLKAIERLNVCGSTGNVMTGCMLLSKGIPEYATATSIDDQESRFFSAMKIGGGVVLASGGALSIASVFAKAKIGSLLGQIAGPCYLVAALLVLVEGILGLHKMLEFRREYLSLRAEKAFAKEPSAKELLRSMTYLQETLLFSSEERGKYFSPTSSYYKEHLTLECYAVSKEMRAFVDQIDKDTDLRNKLRTLSGSEALLLLEALKEQKLRDIFFAQKRAQLARRVSPPIVEKLCSGNCVEHMIEKIKESQDLSKVVKSPEDVRNYFAKQMTTPLDSLVSSLQEIVEGKEMSDAQEILTRASNLDRLVRKRNLQKVVLHFLLILVAFIGIASFITGTLLAGSIVPLMVGAALGAVWTIIDASIAHKITGIFWDCYDPKKEGATPLSQSLPTQLEMR